MEKRGKQLEYLVTCMILVGVGLLFVFMNDSINTSTVLHFGLFQIMQGVLLLICAILLYYRIYVDYRNEREADQTEETAEQPKDPAAELPTAPPEGGEEAAAERQRRRDDVDSVNAIMLLIVVSVLVVAYYMFTMKPKADVVGSVAPLHMVVCVVVFILYACVERWWAMQLDTNRDAPSICNMMVINKAAILALMADMVTSFTGLFSGKACGEEGGIQLRLIFPVFTGRFGKVEETLCQPHQRSSGSGNGSTDGNCHTLHDRADLFQFAGGLVGVICRTFHLITETVRLFSGILKFITGCVNGILILL